MDNNNKPSLGDKLKKGKDLLFGHSEDLPRVIEVDLSKLRPNPDQPRKEFDDEALQELADSIEQHGLIQPITVKRDADGSDSFIVVAGERRYRAFQRLGRDTIPAIMTTGNPDEIALIENIQREDLNPLEEAEALHKMMERHGYTQEELAKVMGKARSTITELLSLTSLPETIREEGRTSDNVSKSVLVELARLKSPEEQLKVWDEIRDGGVTVRTLRGKKEPSKKQSQSATEKLLVSGRGFVSKLERLSADHVTLDAGRYGELVEIYGQVTQLMEKITRKEDSASAGENPENS